MLIAVVCSAGCFVEYSDSTSSPQMTLSSCIIVSGQLIPEYTDPSQPTQGGGGTNYLTSDHLGSTSVVTDATGGVKARHDYLPFGEELSAGIGGRTPGMKYDAPDSTKQRFTQKERHAESGLDYFGARYYSSAQGRFNSADPYTIVLDRQSSNDEQAEARFNEYLADPAHWNRYIYVTDNPLRFIDPDGKQRGESIRRDAPAGQPGGTVDKLLVGSLVIAATAVGIRKAPQIGAAILGWLARNPDRVQQMAQEALQMSTGSPAPAARLPAAQVEEIGIDAVRGMVKGQMTEIAAQVTQRGLSQGDAVGAIQSAVKAVGRDSVAVALNDGSVAVASVKVGKSQPVLIVSQGGQVSRATATIKAGVRDGKPFFEVTNIKPVT